MTRLLSHLIEDAAQRRPEATAVRCRGDELTYGQLLRRANGLAGVLRDRGAKRGERVAVLLTKGLDVPVSFYGVLASGAALVPIDPRSPLPQIERILQLTGATHLVTEESKEDVVGEAIGACPRLTEVVGVDLGDEAGARSLPWSAVDEAASDRPPATTVGDLDPSYILHTSGSSGTPKLILHTHRSAMSFVDWAVREYALGPADRVSNHSSHHTCFATFDLYAAARAGAATVLVTPAEAMMPASLSELMETERLSVWYSVPTALVHLSLRGDLESRDLSTLRWVLFAGESFPRKHLQRLVEQLPTARFSHVYGSTEVNVCTHYHLPADAEVPDPLPIGRACDTAETLVVDEAMRPVAAGEAGELLVRGATVMSGYWDDPETNRGCFVLPEGAGAGEAAYFRTGDRVRHREDGNLVFVTRADFQVKVRGHRVELEEIESALLSLETVEEAAAVTVADGDGEQSLRAAVVIGSDGPEPTVLRAGLSRLLPPQALPAEISVLASLPRTPTGKVDRAELRDLFTSRKVGGGD